MHSLLIINETIKILTIWNSILFDGGEKKKNIYLSKFDPWKFDPWVLLENMLHKVAPELSLSFHGSSLLTLFDPQFSNHVIYKKLNAVADTYMQAERTRMFLIFLAESVFVACFYLVCNI